MTTIINLYGGPGTGKSTSAAYLFSQLKQQGVNAELVREYVKDWAWEGRTITPYDQFYFLGKQIRRESMLLGKVSHIVTDSPVALNMYYSDKHSPTNIRDAVRATISGYYKQCTADNHRHIHVFLTRTKSYNPAGRFQTESEAKKIDAELWNLLLASWGEQLAGANGTFELLPLGTSSADLDKFLYDMQKYQLPLYNLKHIRYEDCCPVCGRYPACTADCR